MKNDGGVSRPRHLLGVCLLGLLAALPAQAHRLRPAIADVIFDDAGNFEVAVQLNLEAVLAGIGPEHEDTSESPKAPEYNALRELPPARLTERFEEAAARFESGVELRFDGERAPTTLVGVDIPEIGDLGVERLSTVRLQGRVPAGAENFTWRYAPEFGESALRIGTVDGGVIRSEWLMAGAVSRPFPLAAGSGTSLSKWRVFGDYTILGFTHIVPKGLDHILFVLGIFLLSLRLKPLLYQVTAFTVAHSITLALSLYGLVSLPSSIVEPLISLSIVYVAVENILTPKLKPWRVYVVFCFGLLHGLGFAGVLTELGLPRSEFATALVAFNIGVELGQLTVITLAFLSIGIWCRHRSWYRARVEIPGSMLIALVGAYWTVERLLG